MGFLDNFFKEILVGEEVSPTNFRYTVYAKKSGYFENIVSIVSYANDKIVLKLKKGVLVVTGKNLLIKKYCQSDICIGGEILSVVFNEKGDF